MYLHDHGKWLRVRKWADSFTASPQIIKEEWMPFLDLTDEIFTRLYRTNHSFACFKHGERISAGRSVGSFQSICNIMKENK